jgi:rod shape-determining protein MreC
MFFAALAVLLMVADTRWQVTQPLRAVIATVLHPVQEVLMSPSRWWDSTRLYMSGVDEARQAQSQAQRQLIGQAERLMRVNQLEHENARLRELLDLRSRIDVPTSSAEILYDAPDPYTRKVVIDQGSRQGVELGSPAIDENGVVGQVTRVYPLTAEITMVTDKDAAVPVINVRTQQRGVAYGTPRAQGMELRFMAGNADVQVGDLLQTSGLDGVYPAGLPVAKVVSVDRRADSAFARIVLAPMANPDTARHVLLLAPAADQMPARPDAAEAAEAASAAEGGVPARRGRTSHHAVAGKPASAAGGKP